MENSGVFPSCGEVVPAEKLNVIYENTNPFSYGDELAPSQVKDEPKVTWNAKPGKYYFLLMIDPDAPSKENPIYGPSNHWMVGNIPGNNIASKESDVVIEYLGAGPPKGSGFHRYVFLLYEQQGKLDFKDAPRSHRRSIENRMQFKVKDFSRKYNLGNPIAGNYFETQWDPYVDVLHKEIVQ